MSSAAYLEEDVVTDPLRDIASIGYLLGYSRSTRGLLAIGLVATLIASLCVMYATKQLGRFVDVGLIGKHAGDALIAGLTFLGLELSAVFLGYTGRRCIARAASHSVLAVRRALFEHLHRLPLSFYDRQPMGRTVTRLTHDVEGLEEFFGTSLARTFMAFATLVTTMFAILTESFVIGVVTMIAMVPSVVTSVWMRTPVRRYNRDLSRKNSAVNARLAEFLQGMPVVRAFALEQWSASQIEDRVELHLGAHIRMNILNSWIRPLLAFFAQVPLVMVLWWGSEQVLAGALGVGVLVTLVRYCERIYHPVMQISFEINTIQQAFTSAERITTFLAASTEHDVMGEDGDVDPGALRGDLRISNLEMSYDGTTKALRGISLHAAPGQKVGIAGRSGSGKSTLIALLSRQYEFQGGAIEIDGIDIRRFKRAALRRAVGVVSQDAIVFRATVRENLALDTACDDARLREACVLTGFSHVLERRALTLDSELLEQGANLSHGERQLLAITRVLLRDPRILILDEATANIDSEHEILIQRATEKLISGRTCIIVAHRLQTLTSCDLVVVFRDGEILEQGSLQSLLDRGGYFSELWRTAAAA